MTTAIQSINDQDRRQLARRIRMARAAANMNVVEFTEELRRRGFRISRDRISRMEDGEWGEEPGIFLLQAMADIGGEELKAEFENPRQWLLEKLYIPGFLQSMIARRLTGLNWDSYLYSASGRALAEAV